MNKNLVLYQHQKDIISDDPKKCGLFLGCGTGKTLTALHLARGKTLVVAPKTTREDNTWQRNLALMDNVHKVELLVVSKEEFRRDHTKLPKCDTFIAEECHTLAGLTPDIRYRKKQPIPKASQLFEAVQEYLARARPERIYTVSATPTRSPMCVLGIAWMLGRTWDFYQFRNAFYTEVRLGVRRIWMPRKDQETKDRLGKAVQKLGYTGRMSDYFDVPKQTYVVKNIEPTAQQQRKIKELATEYPDPIVLVNKKHQVEQGVLKGNEFEQSQVFETRKLEAIEDLVEEYPKVLIFAKYTEQIFLIREYLEQTMGIDVYTLTGDTKDRGTLLKNAEASSRCVVIAQASISAGYELPSFRCTIYASMSYSFVDKEQSEWRTLRSNALDKNIYVYLLCGEVDKAVYKCLLTKKDFHEAQFAKLV